MDSSLVTKANDRHSGIRNIVKFFKFDHLDGRLGDISSMCAYLAEDILDSIPEDNPELTAGLRKLLEAKDCFVRAALP